MTLNQETGAVEEGLKAQGRKLANLWLGIQESGQTCPLGRAGIAGPV